MIGLRFERQTDKPGKHRTRFSAFCEQARANQTAPGWRALVKGLVSHLT
jgi:hypothetical protein